MRKLFIKAVVLIMTAALCLAGCPSPTDGGDDPAQEAANAFKTTHADALAKTTAAVTVADEAAVTAALTAYEALDADAKALLGTEKALLDSLKARIDQLKDATTAQEAADAFKTAHAGVLGKTTATVTSADETAINAALTAYGALSAGAKALLGTEKALLDNLKAKIDELLTAPGKAEDLVLTATVDREIGASWGVLAGATGYEIYYSEDTTEPDEDTTPITAGVTITGTAATIADLTAGTTYSVWVRGTNAGGSGPWSTAASKATLRDGNQALSFAIGSVNGTIGTDTITLTVPFAVDDFTPVVDLSPGASGAFTDTASFPGPRTYRVTAENGATKDYTVTVTQTGKAGDFTLVDPFTEPEGSSLGPAFTLKRGASDGTESHNLTLGVAGSTDIKWYVDDRLRGNAQSLTLNARDYGPGNHYVSVEFVKDNRAYDANLVFTVEAEGAGEGGA